MRQRKSKRFQNELRLRFTKVKLFLGFCLPFWDLGVFEYAFKFRLLALQRMLLCNTGEWGVVGVIKQTKVGIDGCCGRLVDSVVDPVLS